MDTILYSKIQQVNAKVESNEEETKGTFANLVGTICGDDYIGLKLIEGKYASYQSASTPSLSGANVAEFDVSNVLKFKYTYTIEISDYRGLHFVDKNGTYISGVQTIQTEQDISVPNNAVKCFATVGNKDQITIYDINGNDKPMEILQSQATYTSRASGGITYTWNNDHTKVTISGKRTGTSVDTLYSNNTKLPEGMEAGKTYRFYINAVSSAIILAWIPIIAGAEQTMGTTNKEKFITIPDTWDGIAIRIMVTGSGVEVNETIDCPCIFTVPVERSIFDKLDDLENAVYTNSKTNPLACVRRDAGFLSLFHTVGCIGDSLASGESAYKESGTAHYIDLYDFSWGQCLARLTGNTYYNFSKGGLSTKTWLSSSYATDCFDGNHNCDMYFIGLGQNDKNQSLTVGTTADINLSDYTQNADTYCGNMGKIIQRLQILQPKAPIFVFIDPAPPSGDQAYNNVIPDIVDLFDNVWIIDLKTYAKALFTEPTEIIGSQLRRGHYSALGYQEIAFVIATYVDWIVRNNLAAFSQVEFIGTNYEWTD